MSTPSPISTGGGGDHFEQHADAFFLGLLLTGATPPILTDTSVVEVHLQTRHLNWRTDDVLVVGVASDGTRRKLAAQIKRSFSVSLQNEECVDTVQGMWEDFIADDRLRYPIDQLCIIVLHGTSTILHDFSSLLQCARATKDVEDFDRRVSLEGYISKKAKTQNDTLQAILENHIGKAPEGLLYWKFLRSLSVLNFDLNTQTAQTEAAMLSILSHSFTDGPDPIAGAKSSWTRLLQCAAESRPVAKSYERKDLPQELLEKHDLVSSADGQQLFALIEHGVTTRNTIRSQIGRQYEIDRLLYAREIYDHLADNQVLVISGSAGSGKSALAKRLLHELETSYTVLAFQAVEFAVPHINQTLVNATSQLSEARLMALLAGQEKVFIFVDGLERLLEHPVRDALMQLLQSAVDDYSIQLVFTVRDYSLETVRQAFLAPISLSHAVFHVPLLTDEELEDVRANVALLESPLQDRTLRSFLRTPYLLDMACRLNWVDRGLPATARDFRQKCWRELIRAEQYPAQGMPKRREEAFLEIAYSRATRLAPFVRPETAAADALQELERDSLIRRSGKSDTLFATAHDVLEDWAIVRWLEEQYLIADGEVSKCARTVGGFPALRRCFRRWLGELFEHDPRRACEFVLRAVREEHVPSYFRDDCLVSALLSETAEEFVEGCRSEVSGGDINLLCHIVHMLRVACKESPSWIDAPGLPSQMLVPTGPGWVPVLRMVLEFIEFLLPDHALLVLGLIEELAKQVEWSNPAPNGVQEAGALASSLIPHFDEYGHTEARKRLLNVVVKIPRSIPNFLDLIERARTCDHRDSMGSDLSSLILSSSVVGILCKHYPSEVISLVNTRLRLTETDLENREGYFGAESGVDMYFGIREDYRLDYFPASALQGPFNVLLLSHAYDAVNFMLDLFNHAADWYGTRKWQGRGLEPAWKISLEIPDVGTVEQWMNGRLYGLYRGMSVGPYALQSALMALESWLLQVAEIENVDLESWLLYILRQSNNVMATSVVASVCAAYPATSGKAGLAVLSSRDLIQCDQSRLAGETSVGVAVFGGLNPNHFLYEKERKRSNQLKHRRKDIEFLALELQQVSEYQEEVWRILDGHRAELETETLDDEEKRLWRLALHRMDLRGYGPVEPPMGATEYDKEPGKHRIYVGPTRIEPDLQDMVDSNAESQSILNRFIGLRVRATKAWEDTQSEHARDWRLNLLEEARHLERMYDEPESAFRGGPGIAAAVCVRDHAEELSDDEYSWCAEQIAYEIEREADRLDDVSRLSRSSRGADRICASVVGLVVVHGRGVDHSVALALLSTALTHAVDEVRRYAYGGIGAFLSDEHKELVLRCAGVAAYEQRLIETLRREEEALPYMERTREGELIERARPELGRVVVTGGLNSVREIELLDFDAPGAGQAIRTIMQILGNYPDWQESREFYARVTHWLVAVWGRDRQSYTDRSRRDHYVEAEVLDLIALFVLRLKSKDARQVCLPLVRATSEHAREVEKFVHQLILAADGKADDCFWDIWQDIADESLKAPWTKGLAFERPYGHPLIDRLFLGAQWKDDVKHWSKLDGEAHRIDMLALRLPGASVCLNAYLRFLYAIGQRSLPSAFSVVAKLLERSESMQAFSGSDIGFFLETLLRNYVYAEPHRLKTDNVLRNAVLSILDKLVKHGSSSAYRMRDDFVTPTSTI